MTAVDRAAEVLRGDGRGWPDFRTKARGVAQAQALAAAGLLVTDEIQAVLDIAVAIHDGPTGGPYVLHAAVDAYLATKGWTE